MAQYTIVMADLIPGLRGRFHRALKVKDRWERRRALRALAPEVASVSVSIYATRDVDPCTFANLLGGAYFLFEGSELYTEDRGLDLSTQVDEAAVLFF